MRACYSGSFDPVTLGHLDIIRRAAKAADKLFVAVMDNPEKHPMFPADKRLAFVRDEIEALPNVHAEIFSGMMAAFVREKNIDVIIRGVRNYSDFQQEQIMAEYNRALTGGVDTWFIASGPGLAHISSTGVKEVAMLISKDGFEPDILSALVPQRVKECLMEGFHGVFVGIPRHY